MYYKANMEDTTIHKGLWWMPDDEGKQIPGTLIIERDRIVLETIGLLGSKSPMDHFVGDGVVQHDVIWGISSESKKISIFNSHEAMTFNTSCPFSTAKYTAQVVAVGKHIRSLNEPGNYDVKVYIDELPYWFNPNCLHYNGNEKLFTWSADLNNAHQVSVKIEDGCNLELQGEVHFSHTKTGMRVEVEQLSTLNFVFTKPVSMQDAKRKVFAFEQFLSFATLAPVQYSRFQLVDKDNKPDPTKKWTIEIIDKKEKKSGSPERFWEYLFVYETIKDSFPSIIRKWYEEKNSFPIRTHLIDSVGHRGTFCSNDFLIVAQAIEGYYCRYKKDGLGITVILKNLRQDFSDIAILEMSDEDIDCIRDSRHYFSHLLPPGKKEHVVDGLQLYDLNHKLRKLLLCCLLSFIGFSNEEINKIFAKSNNSFLRMIDKSKRDLEQTEPIKLEGEVFSTTHSEEVIPE